jgi:hypothetical protein
MQNPMIPFEQLDELFFNHVLAKIHPMLHPYFIDLHFIYHQEEHYEISSLQELWPDFNHYYMCLPWFVNSAFAISDEQILILGKALVLDFIDSILTDNLVDNQLSAYPSVSLAINHIRIEAMRLFRLLFPLDDSFWTMYEASSQAIWNAFAHEIACVDKQLAPYTLENFLKVCEGKYALYARQIDAMGRLSNKQDLIAPLQGVYRNLFIADCLLDDVGDWKDDAQAKRRTMPIVSAFEAMQIPVKKFSTITPQELSQIVKSSQVMPELIEKAINYLEEALTILKEHGLETSAIAEVIQSRLSNARQVRHLLGRVQGLDMFISAMKKPD